VKPSASIDIGGSQGVHFYNLTSDFCSLTSDLCNRTETVASLIQYELL